MTEWKPSSELVRHQIDFMQHVVAIINYAGARGIYVTGGELFRTQEQQKIYFDTGKSKTMNSNHLKRLAIDLNFFEGRITDGLIKEVRILTSKADLQEIGDYWERLDKFNRWGGNWKSFQDCPHFERNVP